MAKDDLTLSIGVETQKALSSISKFQKEAQQSLEGVSKSFSALKGVAVAAVGVLAGKAVTDFFSAGVDAAKAQETALANLSQQLKLTDEFSLDAVDSFAAFADEMERTSTFGDDLVLSQVAVAKTFGATNEQAQDLVQAAIELSSATGKDLNTSVQALGATLSGTAGKLSKSVPELQAFSKEALQGGAAIQLVLERFSGSAAAQIDTFAGAVTQAGNAFGNFQESFGKIIVENKAVIAGIQAFSEILGELQGLVEDNEGAISDFVTFAVEAIATSIPIAIDVIGFFTRAMEGVVSVGGLAFGGLIEVVNTFYKAWRETIGRAVDVILSFAATITRAVDETPILGSVLRAAGIDTTAAASSIDELRDDFVQFEKDAGESIEGFRDAVIESTVKAVDKFESFNEGFATFQKKVDESVTKIFEADEKTIASAKRVADERAKIGIGASGGRSGGGGGEDEGATTDTVDEETAKAVDNLGAQLDKKFTEIAASFIKSMSGGKEGARQFIGDAVGAAADAFLPGAGSVVAEAIKFLGQDPEAFSEAINGFVEGIPTIIDNIVANIPTLIVTIADNLGPIITSLANAMPRVAIALATAIPPALKAILEDFANGISYQLTRFGGASDAIRNAATNFGDYVGIEVPKKILNGLNQVGTALKEFGSAFIKAFKDQLGGAFEDFGSQIADAGSRFFDSIIEAAQRFIDKITPGSGDGKTSTGGFEEATGVDIPGVKWATGGIVPSGFPNDTFPARLTSGEMVVPRGDVDRLSRFLDQAESGSAGTSRELISLVAEMVGLLRSGQTVNADIRLDSSVLARAILNLNTRNARLAR